MWVSKLKINKLFKTWSCMTTIFKNWIKNATGLNFSWNMTQGSNKMGSKLIDIKEARCRCLLKWNVKVTLTKHVYLKSKRKSTKQQSHCFLFKVNALLWKKSHKTGWQKLLIWDNFVSLLFKVTDIQLDDDILSSTSCRKKLKTGSKIWKNLGRIFVIAHCGENQKFSD